MVSRTGCAWRGSNPGRRSAFWEVLRTRGRRVVEPIVRTDHRVGAPCTVGGVSTRSIVNSWASSPARRRNMQANRWRYTRPELEVRRALHRLGLRYRVAIAPEPVLRRRADIVFTRTRVTVFIDGCFRHGCPEHGRSTFNQHAELAPEDRGERGARCRDERETVCSRRACPALLGARGCGRCRRGNQAGPLGCQVQSQVDVEKYPSVGSASVPMTRPRSRNRLNSSQLVSGSRAQP